MLAIDKGQEWKNRTDPIKGSANVPIQTILDSGYSDKYNVHMDKIDFEWDKNKENINLQKHGISFEEAKTVFYDEFAVQYYDPDHSETEDRFLLLGMSFRLRTIVVCHCYRQEETTIRIISARKANKLEEKEYWRKRK